MAIERYTEGLALNEPDNALNAQLFSNRAAAHMQDKNWGRCIADCKGARAWQRRPGGHRITGLLLPFRTESVHDPPCS